MNVIIFFFGGVAMAVVCSLATLVVMRKSYLAILGDLCGTQSRAGYWVRVSETCLVVITVLAALVFQNYEALPHANNLTLFWSLIRQMTYALATVFISLIVISIVVLRNLPHPERKTEFPNPASAKNH